jgi:cytochrome b561
MQLRNTETRFGLVSISFHWLLALLIIVMLALGLYMTTLPVSPQKFKLYGLHKEIGMTILLLAFLRLFWRLANRVPPLDELSMFEKISAKAMHWLLYGFMFAMPITGWLMTSAAGFPVSFFGWFTVPDLIGPNDAYRKLFDTVHEWLGYGLIAAISLHTAAALKHHFIDKDDILRRML